MKKYIALSVLTLFIGCSQKPAEVVHKREGVVYTPKYSEVYVESPDGKIARSLRGNNDSNKAQQVNIINQENANSYGYYTVESGDSLWSISRKYSMTLPELVELNSLEKPYNIRPGQKIKVTESGSGSTIRENKMETGTYIVKEGDNLSSIANKYNMKTVELAELNNINKPYSIRIGQKLKIKTNNNEEVRVVSSKKSPSGTYIVKPGDNLSTIASNQGMSTGELADLNNLKSPYSLRVGQELKVSKNATSTASTKKITPTPIVTKTKNSNRTNSFIWPVKGEVVSNFGNKANGLFNDGINISASKGTGFKASEDGVVAYVGNELRGYGTIVLIKHNNNWISAYAHCGSVKVARGDKVEKGQIIGTVGQTGNVTSPQLYFSLRNGREAVDPLKYLE